VALCALGIDITQTCTAMRLLLSWVGGKVLAVGLMLSMLFSPRQAHCKPERQLPAVGWTLVVCAAAMSEMQLRWLLWVTSAVRESLRAEGGGCCRCKFVNGMTKLPPSRTPPSVCWWLPITSSRVQVCGSLIQAVHVNRQTPNRGAGSNEMIIEIRGMRVVALSKCCRARVEAAREQVSNAACFLTSRACSAAALALHEALDPTWPTACAARCRARLPNRQSRTEQQVMPGPVGAAAQTRRHDLKWLHDAPHECHPIGLLGAALR